MLETYNVERLVDKQIAEVLGKQAKSPSGINIVLKMKGGSLWGIILMDTTNIAEKSLTCLDGSPARNKKM